MDEVRRERGPGRGSIPQLLDVGGWLRRIALAGLAVVLVCLGSARAAAASPLDENNLCDQPGEAPDLIVADIGGDNIVADVRRWGTIGGVTAYSIAATACNIGTCWCEWRENDSTHPVITQNLFSLKDGRFQHIGQSWVKHAWASDIGPLCGTCRVPDEPGYMGVNCSDLYDTSGNGTQHRLGMKYGVNPHTGSYTFDEASNNQPVNLVARRLQVHNSDLDPANNAGAKYFVEMQYVQFQDATFDKDDNNASYRPVLVTGDSATSVYNIALTGQTVVGQPAIMAWKAADPSVIITEASLPGDGKLYLGTKVTYRGGGIWRYEYAIQNLNAAQAPLAVSIPIPSGRVVSAASYHDVDHHSGDYQDNTPWMPTIGASAVQWKAHMLVVNEVVPNVLRWGSLYNFRFEIDAPPGTHPVVVGFSAPPSQPYDVSMGIPTLTPSVCDGDGVCDAGEACATCAADCASQGSGSGCCGNGSCEAGESGSSCFADCGQAVAAESMCGDGIDGDRDGQLDCFDTDCCADAACDVFDIDGDGLAAACDCNDGDDSVWTAPGEARALIVVRGSAGDAVLGWAPPQFPGGSPLAYDAIRSASPQDFSEAGTCLSVEFEQLSATDAVVPPAGGGFFYLVRAKNACPAIGPLGSSSSGTPHTAPACP